MKKFFKIVKYMFFSVIYAWKNAKKETKHWLAAMSATGVLLLIILFLAVRLHSVSKELETVHAMSTALQEELQTIKEMTGQLAADKKNETQGGTENPKLTEQPGKEPTKAPTLTIEEDKYIVCIDAGHGDYDGGAVLQEGGQEVRIEKNDNLWLAKKFRDALKEYDIEVVMTREDDTFIGLTERPAIANAADADLLISLHRNSYAGNEPVQGVEIWLHNSRPAIATELATNLLAAIEEVGVTQNRGVKYGTIGAANENYAINSRSEMTSMIIEFGFISSVADNLNYDEHGEAYAKAMAEVVYEWFQAQ